VAFALCTAIWNGIVVPIENGTNALSGALEGWMHTQYPLWIAAYLLTIMLMSAWRGDQAGLMQAIRIAFLASILYALCSNAETFNHYITGLAHGTVGAISTAIGNVFGAGGERVTAGTFDLLATKAFAVGAKVFSVIPWYSPKGLVLCIPVVGYWMVSEGVIAAMFGVWLVSYVVTEVVLAFGPLMVGIYAFPFLRPTAHGWFRVVLSGLLTQIMLVGTLAIFLKVLTTTLGSVVGLTNDLGAAAANTANTPVAGEGDIAGSVFVLIFSAAACALFFYVILEIVKLARAIAGAPGALVPNWGQIGQGAAAVGGGVRTAAAATSNIGGSEPSPSAAGARRYAFQRTTVANP
jgi:type IV secretory pathway VirB6-like protein